MSCPPLETCMVNLRTTTAPPVTSAHTLDAPLLRLTKSLREFAVPRREPGEIEMPWIWMALRAQVYSRMPTYEQGHDFKLTLSPVVVSSPSDTVPGVGVAGDF
jgi:hypothetical protein